MCKIKATVVPPRVKGHKESSEPATSTMDQFSYTPYLAILASDERQLQNIINDIDSFRRDFYLNILDINGDCIRTITGTKLTNVEDKDLDVLVFDLKEKYQTKYFRDLAWSR